MATKQKVNKAGTTELAIAQVNSGNAAPDAMLRLQEGIQQMLRGYAQVFSALADLTGQSLVGTQPLAGSQSQAGSRPLVGNQLVVESQIAKGTLAGTDNQKNDVPAFQSKKSVEQKAEAAAEESVTQPEAEQEKMPAEAESAKEAPVQNTETNQNTETAQTVQPSSEVAEDSDAEETKAVQISKDDLLREIQGKFKKDKKNQERIRNILGAYGIANLSQLPPEKYEDFMGDVRQL